ncbi:hypothetical protein DAPPUDRAFT_250656 [Daphnia pulex]|uniref:Uncharacterized protein n=1 Tax=Daphnia pulex TaxID=6669 RepID=E9GZ20_DAPPU|nr:hypothetical protein DAPPUDRAFT_250656 [Daphnia pulex]|eukprot:EFX75253.1 hypothetical protein DAPPUDRAFT_250656 [Daphnia pulex]
MKQRLCQLGKKNQVSFVLFLATWGSTVGTPMAESFMKTATRESQDGRRRLGTE